MFTILMNCNLFWLQYIEGMMFLKGYSENQETHNQCFIKGECQLGRLLRKSTTLGKTACLNFCKRVEGCLWFTYHPSDMMCLTFSYCKGGISSTSQCLDCLSGESSCISQIKNCWSKGTCSGELLLLVFLILTLFTLLVDFH